MTRRCARTSSSAKRRDHDQGLHRRLPLRCLVLGLRQLRDEIARLLQRDEPATARQRDRVVELAGPARRLIRQRKHALQNRAKAN